MSSRVTCPIESLGVRTGSIRNRVRVSFRVISFSIGCTYSPAEPWLLQIECLRIALPSSGVILDEMWPSVTVEVSTVELSVEKWRPSRPFSCRWILRRVFVIFGLLKP